MIFLLAGISKQQKHVDNQKNQLNDLSKFGKNN